MLQLDMLTLERRPREDQRGCCEGVSEDLWPCFNAVPTGAKLCWRCHVHDRQITIKDWRDIFGKYNA
jgi:hypothetical protein